MNTWTRLGVHAALALSLSACGLLGERRAETVPETEAPAAVADLGDPQARFDEALEMLKRNQLPAAEAALQALERDFPQYLGPPLNLGLIYARTDRNKQAIGALSRAEQLKPDHAVTQNALGAVYQRTGQWTRAETAFRRAIALDAEYAAPQLNLGMLLEVDLKRPEEALPLYRRYLALTDDEELRVQAWIAAINARASSNKAVEGQP